MIRFDDPSNRDLYNRTEAGPDWQQIWTGVIHLKGKYVTELGCGGGTYCRTMATMGAHVIGVDASAPQLETARSNSEDAIRWIQADAAATGLPHNSQDIVLMRTLIHHLPSPVPVLRETVRILRPGGWAVIQDRTLADCLLPFTPGHLRGYLFEYFPHLAEVERKRRFSHEQVLDAMNQAGLVWLHHRHLWETRNRFPSIAALNHDFLSRQNRSILHQLSDEQLLAFTRSLVKRLQKEGVTFPIPDGDRWTLWMGQKPAVTDEQD